MEIFEFGYKFNSDCVLCLGYFDAIHKGHKALINSAKTKAQELGVKLGVVAFCGGKNGQDVFTFSERLTLLKMLGVDFVVYASLTPEFMAISHQKFTEILFNSYNVKAVFCGFDFTYGYKAQGNSITLKDSAKKYGANVYVLDKVLNENGQKISTSLIKNELKNGNIKGANELLDGNYFITEKVVEGKKLGKTLNFPTINMRLSEQKFLIKEGVYLTFVIIDNKLYSSITNVGKQPTFNGNNCVIETYINDFDGNLYGKYITVYFVEFIREIKAFNSQSELVEQLKKDKEFIND
ncbi:MAG: riboflavin biosynthesis protein RibF [Clostridia bacterium]|nr:riboflavin biosynthesis protein RibF [Clostridia bacterium]